MKIYAVRDRLIDYFLQPFVGNTDKQIMASLAIYINNRENTDALAQAPQHFELWRLGEVLEDGQIIAYKEFLADCSTLIRATTDPRNTTAEQTDQARTPDLATERRTHTPSQSEGDSRTKPRDLPDAAQTAPGARE